MFFKHVVIYFNYFGYLNRCKLLGHLNYNTTLFALRYRRRYQRLVFVRSPKHFNIGKHQFFYIRTSFQVKKQLSLKSYSSPNLHEISYNNFVPVFPKLPSAQAKHLKVCVTQKINFFII